ncbi:MAG: HNH endonuclease, partial [Gammaproteobacteria bacterium]
NQLSIDYEKQVKDELAHFPNAEIKATEIERIVRQRIGQQKFREAMLEYWGSACAATGVDVPEVLRASHAKPWAECDSDAERLDVFNGFLLCAHFDALFDRFLISFDDMGQMLISPKLSQDQRNILGLNDELRLRWIADRHLLYLGYHRTRFFDLQGV